MLSRFRRRVDETVSRELHYSTLSKIQGGPRHPQALYLSFLADRFANCESGLTSARAKIYDFLFKSTRKRGFVIFAWRKRGNYSLSEKVAGYGPTPIIQI